MTSLLLAARLPWRVSIFLLLLLTFGGVNPVHAANGFSIGLENMGDRAGIVVRGEVFAQLGDPLLTASLDWPLAKWTEVLSVRVVRDSDLPAPDMLGEYQLSDTQLLFLPRFPLQPGLEYQATFRPAALASVLASYPEVQKLIALPKVELKQLTKVTAIYPTSDRLPSNLLKFYVQFSAPVRQGDALQHVQLITADGRPVDDAFVNVGQELWDTTGTRLTLLLDPGRIKQGLRPRSEIGPVLRPDSNYQLTISQAWRDAHGRPLAEEYSKRFEVTALDQAQPDPDKWQIASPSAGSLQPLQITFDESLDSAFAQHAIEVVSQQNEVVTGSVQLSQAELLWTFTPVTPWLAGEYSLVVDGRLEDLAANSVGRPFETLIDSRGNSPDAIERITLPLLIQ